MSEPTPSKELEDRVHRVFSELNQKIQAWFNGAVPNTDEAFAPIAARCHPEMSYVFPSGGEVSCADVLDGLRGGWGNNKEIRLVTPREPCRLMLEEGHVVVAEALELQDGAKAVKPPRHARRTTLILRKDAKAPHGLLLWRLHESVLGEEEAKHIDWAPLDGG